MAVSTDVLTENFLNCSTTARLEQRIDINRCQDVTIEDITMKQAVSINTTCMQKAINTSTVSNDLAASMQQQADSVGQAFSMTTTESNNYVKNVATAITNVQNTNFTECTTDLNPTQAITCGDSVSVVIKKVDFEQSVDDVASCIQDTTTVQNVANTVSTAISQTASAKTEGLFSWLGDVIIAMVVAVVAIVVLKLVLTPKAKGAGPQPGPPTGLPTGLPTGPQTESFASNLLTGGMGSHLAYTIAEKTGLIIATLMLVMSIVLTIGYPITATGLSTMWPYIRTIPNATPSEANENKPGVISAITENSKNNAKIEKQNMIIFICAGLLVDMGAILALVLIAKKHKQKSLELINI